MDNTTVADPIQLATELTVAWLSNPNTRASGEDVPAMLASMHKAVSALVAPVQPAEADEEAPGVDHAAAVSVRKSLASKDHIISMIDGKPYKTLRRHLSRHGLTPEQYRERYKLRPDYPMVSESYSAMRRDMAKTIGLGRKPKANMDPATPPQPTSATKPGRGRPRKAAAPQN